MAEPNKLYEMASPQIQQYPAYQISGFPKNFLPRYMKREEPQLNLELSLQCQTTADEENNDVPKLKKVKLEYDDQMVESGKVALDSMPIVITRGKEMIGILYSQNPVKIVCICHAKFFSPDDFVQHAGAGGVINPLQYITVLTK